MKIHYRADGRQKNNYTLYFWVYVSVCVFCTLLNLLVENELGTLCHHRSDV